MGKVLIISTLNHREFSIHHDFEYKTLDLYKYTITLDLDNFFIKNKILTIFQ